jgi:predicted DNA-binding protein
VISLRLPTARLEQLDAMAARTGMARTSLIQLAIERLLNQGL